jgi:hypothetical protein
MKQPWMPSLPDLGSLTLLRPKVVLAEAYGIGGLIADAADAPHRGARQFLYRRTGDAFAV